MMKVNQCSADSGSILQYAFSKLANISVAETFSGNSNKLWDVYLTTEPQKISTKSNNLNVKFNLIQFDLSVQTSLLFESQKIPKA